MLKIDVVTIFPDMFDNIIEFGVLKEAFKKNICQLNIYNLRDFSNYKHGRVDDRPYGGGPGMVLMPEPIDNAITFIKKKNKIKKKEKQKVVLLSPRGEKLNQNKLKYLSNLENIILICGRYEGVDQRVIDSLIDSEISIGDYVLTGGEIPAMVIIDGAIRLLPGVVGKEESLKSESFEDNLLDYSQYTRPPVFKGMDVPKILLSGNHKDIQKWRKEKSLEITRIKRPDLIDKDG
ncbi:MAG: tRNA (guanosine(37)-N1)-methyltransferase TrmD [Actinomycetia bacterium]|nr:tRNA (guanosine(37)-N1)-methyltransferase TrmD [Actinomycetota bacterium]MCG2790448.1 tRNA (guanosine(37)-N1)-methyltransferase TrmD [Actinomycetes bacterium]